MHKLPSQELAVEINKLLHAKRAKLKHFQDKHGNINFNLLVGMVLGAICCFHEKPAINEVLAIFNPILDTDKQFKAYADLMMGLNNYLVYQLDSNNNTIFLLEENKWVGITETDLYSVYSLWYAFHGMMKVEFEENKKKINAIKSNPITTEALDSFTKINEIMTLGALSFENINAMQTDFFDYARKINELRKLIYNQRNGQTSQSIH